MEVNEIVGYSSSFVLTTATLIFNESIKEVIRNYFSVKSKKQIKKYYTVILCVAIILPLVLIYFTSGKLNKSKIESVGNSVKIQPMEATHKSQ